VLGRKGVDGGFRSAPVNSVTPDCCLLVFRVKFES